jgi:pyrroline-5-carboxylate reductase
MAPVARSIAGQVATSRALVISVAAGIRLQDIARWLGPGVPLIRTMPNRPALIGAGITALYAMPTVDTASRQTAETILAACGPTVWVPDELQLDVVTAVSGSGPAYFFLLIECLEAAGVQLGLAPATARKLAIETARGSGQMAAEATDSPAELRAQVTSKGGTTAAALEVLEAAGVRGTFAAAVAAGASRSAELAREFGTL